MRALVIACIALSSVAKAGEIYRYEDDDGTVVYTNVPPKPRQRVQRLAAKFGAAQRATAAPVKTGAGALAAYDAVIEAAAKRYRIPANLVRAVMHAESAFNPFAVSLKGAMGLMQLMPRTAEEMYVRDAFDARQNIEGGARYLRQLANEFQGDMVKMVAAYNAGPEAVRRCGECVPQYSETQAYVRKVIALYFEYKARYR